MVIVVGTGPTAVSALSALVERGEEILLLDAGKGEEVFCPSGVTEPFPRIQDPGVSLLHKEDSGFFPAKPRSREVFATPPFPLPEGIEIPTAHAVGGLSRLWGGAILPAHPRDLKEWPLPYEELIFHYRKVLSFIRVSGEKDPLCEEFPLLTDELDPLPLHPGVIPFWERLRRFSDPLREQGILVGRARIALRLYGGVSFCTLCGLCFSGCPYDLIYHSAETLTQLLSGGNISYTPGVVVERIEESARKVIVYTRRKEDGLYERWEGERVYLACGALESSAIVLRSLPPGSHRLPLRSSHIFLIPFLGWDRIPSRQGPSLAQLFFELTGICPCDHTVHLQLYAPSEPLRDLVSARLNELFPFLPGFFQETLEEHLLFFLGFFHSDHSHRFLIESTPSGWSLTLERNPQVRRMVFRVMGRLWRNPRAFPGLSFPLWELTPIGRGMHFGASFPIRKDPSGYACDLMGRPCGFSRIHLVDTSSLPSLPASTLTLTAMANAHRIASCAL